MYLAQNALTAITIIVLVTGQDDNIGSHEFAGESQEKLESTLNVNHTFVALIDIVFIDNTKRTCTGAIVHDNVVITAAHCFVGKDKYSSSKPELTASFVVIGTKKMFDTGYEQYLPIERIVVHPKYEGWTADLALVFTFAGMTADKPGTVIPLAGDKSTAHLDSNVTVFSWGHTRSSALSSLESLPEPKKIKKYKKLQVSASDESCDSDENIKHVPINDEPITERNTVPIVGKRFRNENDDFTVMPLHRSKKKKHPRVYGREKNKKRHERAHDYPENEDEDGEEKLTSTVSRYLTIIVDTTDIVCTSVTAVNLIWSNSVANRADSSNNPNEFNENESLENIEKSRKRHHKSKKKHIDSTRSSDVDNVFTEKMSMSQEDNLNTETVSIKKGKRKKKIPRISYSFKSNNDWRRSMGSQQNRLLVENFGFVNLHTCRALVDKALPAKYNISKHNDVICYTNVERCVDERDSGAPAVRQGQLLAITIGGAECEGDQVAVGLRMACYCSWISDNLPVTEKQIFTVLSSTLVVAVSLICLLATTNVGLQSGSTSLSCCRNCCDVKHKDEKKKERRHKFRNRFI